MPATWRCLACRYKFSRFWVSVPFYGTFLPAQILLPDSFPACCLGMLCLVSPRSPVLIPFSVLRLNVPLLCANTSAERSSSARCQISVAVGWSFRAFTASALRVLGGWWCRNPSRANAFVAYGLQLIAVPLPPSLRGCGFQLPLVVVTSFAGYRCGAAVIQLLAFGYPFTSLARAFLALPIRCWNVLPPLAVRFLVALPIH